MSDTDRYELRPMNMERLEEVAAAWTVLAGGHDEFEVELGNFFEWCTAHLEVRQGDGYALELYNVSQEKTDAILDVNDGGWRRMTKLLKMHLSPEFWPVDGEGDAVVKTHAGAYATFILGNLGEGVDEVKIYGRTHLMVRMLTLLQSVWHKYNTGSVAKMQGQWLTITRS